MKIDPALRPGDLLSAIERLWERSARCIRSIERTCPPGSPSPVFTVRGRYTARGWTEWTQGFQYGAAILQFDATGDPAFLRLGRARTREIMAPHLTHVGVHDHGFNNVSTYGNLWRLLRERKVAPEGAYEAAFYELALKNSGAVQARRWTRTADGGGFIYSFNGPHSLFADTIRSLRALALSHRLGHALLEEHDRKVSLLERLVQHATATSQYAVYFGASRDSYDVRGRVAHESVFNTNDGHYRCPNSQQGYSGFTTWTRGLAWIMLGYAEQLEFLATVPDAELRPLGGRKAIETLFLRTARATCDFYIDHAAAADGIPYWDTGAPGLTQLEGWRDRPADPFNRHEPVDSSAAAIGAQGLLRLGRYLQSRGKAREGARYFQAGLTVLRTLLAAPYLGGERGHQGLILHSVYHRPNGWDHVPQGQCVPCGEASMWGDYHAREVALYVQRLARDEPYLTFFGPDRA